MLLFCIKVKFENALVKIILSLVYTGAPVQVSLSLKIIGVRRLLLTSVQRPLGHERAMSIEWIFPFFRLSMVVENMRYPNCIFYRVSHCMYVPWKSLIALAEGWIVCMGCVIQCYAPQVCSEGLYNINPPFGQLLTQWEVWQGWASPCLNRKLAEPIR